MTRRVLHVVDRTSGGVPVAVRAYVRNSPSDVEHTILSPFRAGSAAPVWEGTHATHVELGEGHATRIRRVAAAVRRIRPDAVHAHSSYSGVYARLAVRKALTQVIYSPHCFSFERRDIGVLSRTAFRAVEAALGWNTDVLAACGPGERDVAERLTSLRGRAVVVPNVSSLPARSAASWQGGPLWVGMAGRLSPQKDPPYFEEALARLTRVHSQVRGMWIGAPDHSHDHRFTTDVETTGWLAPSHLARALSRLHLYVHSASWEGFPIAILDAYAAGLPILCRPIRALPAMPAHVTVEQGTQRLRSVLPSARLFVEWAQENRAAWSRYLAGNTDDAQRSALASLWGSRSERSATTTDAGA